MTLERIGDSEGFGWLLIDILERHGWVVEPCTAFAGDGVLLTAEKEHREWSGWGPTHNAAALNLFEACGIVESEAA